jgi:anti-sigma regulatory factor (Ser/Thr protein kinase)
LLAERTVLTQRQAELLQQQRAFLKDVLFAVTDGTLILCDSEAELPAVFVPQIETAVRVPLSAAPALRLLRREAQRAASSCNLSVERTIDLITAVSEAAMNVVSHAGGGGEGYAVCDPEHQSVQIWITDNGPGIPLERLHRALLERGFTTKGTLGHGFWLMLQTADRIHLLTREGHGTTLVIEKGRSAPVPDWAERQ